ncbi:MAG: tetratricopeptide repeat protein [Mariprofundaceae bacterium]
MKRCLVFLGLCAVFAATWLLWVDARYHAGLEQGKRNLATHALNEAAGEVGRRFREAVMMLHAKQYENAIKSLHRVLEINPKMPEAYVNMGFALLGLEDYRVARDFFEGAIELKPLQFNAYYGLGEALMGMKDFEGALGAMRAYVHLVKPDDPFASRANAKIAELKVELGRSE